MQVRSRDTMKGMRRSYAVNLLRAIALIGVIGLGLWLGRFVASDDAVQTIVRDLGYLGIFLVAYGSGFNLVVPIPAATFVPAFTAAGFGFWTVIGIMTFGLTAADMTAFLLGRVGRKVDPAPSRGWAGRIERFQERHPKSRTLVLFLYASFFPLPNEVLLLPMGYLGARVRDVILPVLFGNLVFNAIASGGVIALGGLL